jgi:uncharacterized protein YecT (DUF1311 family)
MKATLKFGIFLIATLLAIPVYGQHMNEKNSPCANVAVTTELTKCLSDAKDRADAKLNTIYKEIRGRLEGADAERLTKTRCELLGRTGFVRGWYGKIPSLFRVP